jgi:hypothetical protein
MAIQLIIDNPGIGEFEYGGVVASTANPGAGKWTRDHATDGSVARIDISTVTANGLDVSDIYDTLTVGTHLYLRFQGEAQTYVIAAGGVTARGAWYDIAVTHVNNSTSWPGLTATDVHSVLPVPAASASAPEGTDVKSTGELTGLVLTSDGVDGASWQSGTAPGAHDLSGSAHNASTLANFNLKITDANLDDAGATRVPTQHALDSAQHTQAPISDAQHGVKNDPTLHVDATPTTDGFMPSGDKAKIDRITVTQAVNLDTMETNSDASKAVTDQITVTAPVNLDTVANSASTSKTITDRITVTQAVDLDTMEADTAASKDVTEHLSVTQPVDLDAIEISVGFNDQHRQGDGTDHQNVLDNTNAIAALGTASTQDVGVLAGNVVQMIDSGGPKLPGVDGSLLQNVVATGTLNVEDGGVPLAGGPHDTMDVYGAAVVADVGGGKFSFTVTPGSAPVASVFGRTDVVLPVAGDYTAAQVTNDPAGTNLVATDVQAAINELDARAAGGGFGSFSYDGVNTVGTGIGSGEIRFSDPSPSLASQMFISVDNEQGVDIGPALAELLDYRVSFAMPDDGLMVYLVDIGVAPNAPTLDVGGTFYTIPITSVGATGAPSTGDSLVLHTIGKPVVVHSGDISGTTVLTIDNDAVTTAKILNDAVTLDKMDAGTAGGLIAYDASGNPAEVTPGTATYVLTSAGADVPTWEQPGAPGNHDLGGATQTSPDGGGNQTVGRIVQADGLGAVEWADTVESFGPAGSPRTGAVVPTASDYDASDIDNDSANVAGTYVSDALDTLEADKITHPTDQDGFVLKTGPTAYIAIKSNLSATRDPAGGDDESLGYAIGSRWLNTSADTEWVCMNAAAGFVSWKETTSLAGAAHNTTHSAGGADPVKAQDLDSTGAAAGHGILSDGAGAWTVVSVPKVITQLAEPAPGNNGDIWIEAS